MLATVITFIFICLMFLLGTVAFIGFIFNRERDFMIAAISCFALNTVLIITGLHFGLE